MKMNLKKRKKKKKRKRIECPGPPRGPATARSVQSIHQASIRSEHPSESRAEHPSEQTAEECKVDSRGKYIDFIPALKMGRKYNLYIDPKVVPIVPRNFQHGEDLRF